MGCDFIKSITAEQKKDMLKLLQEENQPKPILKYRVELEFWGTERTQIKSLNKYAGKQRHGKKNLVVS